MSSTDEYFDAEIRNVSNMTDDLFEIADRIEDVAPRYAALIRAKCDVIDDSMLGIAHLWRNTRRNDCEPG